MSYLDVITVRTSNGAVNRSTKSAHSNLLIEPVLLPNLDHIQLDKPKEISNDNCLFYPSGHKSRGMKREIEVKVKTYLLNDAPLIKEKRKPIKVISNDFDKFAHVKSPPLYYSKKKDVETEQLIKNVRDNIDKINGTVNIRI
jgi:hypothetical protein